MKQDCYNEAAETRFQRRELTHYLQKDHEVIRQFLNNQHLKVNSVEKTIPLRKPNKFNLIKTKLENISRTLHIRYIRSKASFAGHSRATN